MKRHLIAIALSALSSLPCVAAGNDRPSLSLLQAIARVEADFPGEVIAAEFDGSAREAAHYHVDLRLLHGALVRFEVDAAAGSLLHVPRNPERLPDAETVAAMVARLATVLPGRVNAVEFDDTNPRDPHYHVRVTGPTGFAYTLRVDPAAVNLGWREAAARPR